MGIIARSADETGRSAFGRGYLAAGLLLLVAYAASAAAMALLMAGPPDPGMAIASLPRVLAAFAPMGLLGVSLVAASRTRAERRARVAAIAAVVIAAVPAGTLLLALAGQRILLLVPLAAFAVFTIVKPRVWPAFALLVLAPLVALSAYFTWADLNEYGSSPSYRAASYGELQADLSRDCPEIRFPDLSPYESAPGFNYCINYNGGRVTMRYRGYSVGNDGEGALGGMKAAADGAGVESEIALLEISCYDLRQYDGHYRTAPDVSPNMEHGGIGVEFSETEFDVSEENKEHPATFQGYPVGSRYGRFAYKFAMGGYYYYVGASYGILPGTSEEEAREIRDAADREARDLAFSIIDQ